MAFTGNEAEEFPLNTAAEWTANYRATMNGGDPKAHFFGMNIINDVLAQEGCVGIRVYYGVDESGKKQLIIVGADVNENDLYQGVIAERSIWCPPFCDGNGSPLNA